MDQANPEGVVAPVETTVTPAVSPEGPAPEAVKPANEAPAKPEAKSDDEPKGVAKRIKELTDRIKAAEAREARYLSMLERQQAPTQPAAASDDEPLKTFKDFNYDEKAFLEYAEKRAEARADKAAKAAAERWRQEQEAISRRAKFDERLSAFGKTNEEFDGVVDWLYSQSAPISDGMADFLMDSEEPGLLAMYLHNNEDEARKFAGLSAAKAGRELQKLEDRLIAERKKAAEKPVTKAPAPAPKIEGAEPALKVSASSPESDKLSTKEWVKAWEREHRKKD